jgi:hypothetical protein
MYPIMRVSSRCDVGTNHQRCLGKGLYQGATRDFDRRGGSDMNNTALRFRTMSIISLVLACTMLPSEVRSDCPNAPDKAIDCRTVTTPCFNLGRPDALLGNAPAGKEFCSGNNLTTLSLRFSNSLGAQLNYNSQIHPNQRGLRAQEGFGNGWSFLARIEAVTANRITLRGGDGSYTFYLAAGRGQWRSENWGLGDLSLLMRTPNGDYILEERDGSQSTFSAIIGNSRYITEAKAPTGLKTTITYAANAPLEIRNSHGEFLRFTCQAGFCSRVVDNNGVAYTFSYRNNRLVGMTNPESVITSIEYTIAVSDAETLIASVSDSRSRSSTTYAYYNHGVIRAIGDDKLATVFTYSANDVTRILNTIGTGSEKEFSKLMYTRLANSPWVTEVRTGDGSPEGNQGVLVARMTRLQDGRISTSSNAEGVTTHFFYSQARNPCDPRAAQTSPVPTCVVSPTGARTTTTFADTRFYAPSALEFFDPTGSPLKRVSFTWMASSEQNATSTIRANMPLSTVVSVANRDVSKTLFSYQATEQVYLPKSMTTTTLEQYGYDTNVRGRPTWILSSIGDKTAVQYDELGRPTSVSTNGETTSYAYETQNNGTVTVTAQSPFATFKKTSDFRGLEITQNVTYSAGTGAPTVLRSISTSEIRPSNQTTESSTIASHNGGTYTYTGVRDYSQQQNGSFTNTTIENIGN